MIIHNPVITGSLQVNGTSVSSIDQVDTISGSVVTLTDASASLAAGKLNNTTDTLTGDLTVTGKITAQEFHTEFVSSSIIYQSGSTQFGDSTDDTHIFTGYVGIGTAPNNRSLSVYSSQPSTRIQIDSENNNAGVLLVESGVDKWSLASANSSLLFYDETASTTRLAISSSGKVGIGTLTPTNKLTIYDEGYQIKLIDGSSSNSGEILVANTALAFYSDRDNTVADSNIQFNVDNDVKMYIKSDGNVGIGTANPLKVLHLFDAQPTLRLQDDDSDYWDILHEDASGDLRLYSSVASGNVMTVQEDGTLVLNASGQYSSPFVSSWKNIFFGSNGTLFSRAAENLANMTLANNFYVEDQSGSPVNVRRTGASASAITFSGATISFIQDNSTGAAGSTVTMTEPFRIDAGGNIGISTSSPSRPLHIAKTSGGTVIELQRTNANTTGAQGTIQFTNNAGLSTAAISGTGDGTNDGGEIVFYTTGSASDNFFFSSAKEAMRITSNGDVRIGASSTKTNNLGFINTSGVVSLEGQINQTFTINARPNQTTEGMDLQVRGGTSLWLDYDRNVGVGTTNPYAKFTVAKATTNSINTDDASNTSHMTLSGTDAFVRLQLGVGNNTLGPYGGWIQASYDNGGGADGTEPLLLNPLGNAVGIGTTSISAGDGNDIFHLHSGGPKMKVTATNNSSGFRIDVYGDSGSTLRLQSSGATKFTVYNNGNYDFTGSDVSDIVFKENITEIASGLPIINALVPKTYNFIGREEIRKGGFIAQEVEEILPEAVHGEEGQKGLDYNSILAHAVKAIQELKSEVDSLKAQLNS